MRNILKRYYLTLNMLMMIVPVVIQKDVYMITLNMDQKIVIPHGRNLK